MPDVYASITEVDPAVVERVADPNYMLSIADRGAEALGASGTIGRELVDALKAEARRRVTANEFFGHVAYASLSARKPEGPP